MTLINNTHTEQAKNHGICLKSGRSMPENLFSPEFDKDGLTIKYGFDGEVDIKDWGYGNEFLTNEELIDLSEQMIAKWQDVIEVCNKVTEVKRLANKAKDYEAACKMFNKHLPVTTLEDLLSLNGTDLIEGYTSTRKDTPEPEIDKSRAFHHGWRVRMMDYRIIKITEEHSQLTKEYLSYIHTHPLG